jgi:hypothetical protein
MLPIKAVLFEVIDLLDYIYSYRLGTYDFRWALYCSYLVALLRRLSSSASIRSFVSLEALILVISN